MTKWEYRLAASCVNTVESWFNEQGAEGWELVSAYTVQNDTKHFTNFIFKRPVPVTDGWIEWTGNGQIGLASEDTVKVKYRSGNYGGGRVDLLRWAHLGLSSDIVAYRIG